MCVCVCEERKRKEQQQRGGGGGRSRAFRQSKLMTEKFVVVVCVCNDDDG